MTDILVIGSGIAGLSFALKTAQQFPDKKILVLTKASEDESNTKYAQGGIAAVLPEAKDDSLEHHVQDTLSCGAGLCDEKIVRIVVAESGERINELIAWGTEFDKNKSGSFDLAMEGGHSAHRVRPAVGQEIDRDEVGAEEERVPSRLREGALPILAGGDPQELHHLDAVRLGPGR